MHGRGTTISAMNGRRTVGGLKGGERDTLVRVSVERAGQGRQGDT
jgi:hypothetical protein